MTTEELKRYLENPSLLNKQTLYELEQLVHAYPYVHTFVFLYLYNLALLEDLRYFSELKRLAIVLPSRSRLYSLVEKRYVPSSFSSPLATSTENKFACIDRFLNEQNSVQEEREEELFTTPQNQCVALDYFDALERGLLPSSSENHVALDISLPQKEVEEEVPEEGPLFTETLAKLYIQQQCYDRALSIIETIRAKDPNKNAYFADQIRFLQRLQEINK